MIHQKLIAGIWGLIAIALIASLAVATYTLFGKVAEALLALGCSKSKNLFIVFSVVQIANLYYISYLQ